MTNINANFSTSYTTTSQNSRNTNDESNLFSTELLLALIETQQKQEETTTENSSYYSLENSGSGDMLTSFTEMTLTEMYGLSSSGVSNSKTFTTVIDWSCYEKTLSDSQIAGLSRQYGGELTLTEYAEAMKAIARLANAKNEEDEVLEEMSERIVYGEDDLNAEVVTMQSKYSNEFMDNLKFYDIDKNTEFFNSDANIFDEFKLLLENTNYDYVNFFSLLGDGDGDTDKFKLAIQEVATTEIDEKKVSIEEDSPLNLNKYGGFSHLTPLIVQDIKTEIENQT